ncbi:MAG: tetratricopeptide repeat protein [Muribaculaceae bacterium]|nr:tetratricopeptide repeat protein [Muribaculaceae bacterium]
MKKIIVLLAACVVALTSVALEVPDSAFEADPYFLLMGEADRAIADSRWEEAAARLTDALAVKPDHPSNALLFNNLASVYGYMEMDSLAVATYTRGLDIAPNMLTLVLGRAKALLAIGHDAEAYADFDHAVAIDSVNTDARYYRGMMRVYGGDLTGAEEDFGVLSRVAPKSNDTAVALATLYVLTGRNREAVSYLKKLISVDPAAEYYANLAGCYLELGDLTEASEVIATGLEAYPNDAELYYYRARLNRDRYRPDDAQADARHAIKLGVNPVRVRQLFESKK